MVVEKDIGKIRIAHFKNPNIMNTYIDSWKNSKTLHYSKYQIKETDLRVKTATFSSPDYIDLTTGLYAVLISSKYHENFSGIVLDVDYDPSTGLYNYQCQDWSRTYMQKTATGRWVGDETIYTKILNYVTRIQLQDTRNYNYEQRKKKNKNAKDSNTYSKAERAKYKHTLSGIRPLWQYDQSIYKGNNYKGNPFKKKPKGIFKGKTYMEAIRTLVFSQLGYFDVWFNDRGILQIEPLAKKDWESTGLHLTTQQMASQKYKFSTTNAVTQVAVEATGLSNGKLFTSKDLGMKLDLTMFFGWQGASISDPTQKDKNTSNATKKTTITTNVNSENPYGTKRKEVWITIDNIFGQSADRKIMNDFAKAVEKAGWKTHVGNVGPSYHYAHAPGYSWSGQVQDAVWFVIYGGACAGTLNEAATANWYRQPLTSRGSRTVVGFIHPPCGDIRKGGSYYSWLPRAHDDDFSPPSFTGLKNPGQFLTDKAIPWMYAKDGTSLAASFLKGGDNPEACNKNWKF